MINFIVVTESLLYSSLIEDKIDSTLFKSNLEYKIYLFNSYNDNFFKLTFSNLENKVFIFDLDNKDNGFDIAKKIRNNDKLSEIIFIGSYNKDYINSFLISSICSLVNAVPIEPTTLSIFIAFADITSIYPSTIINSSFLA